MTRTKTITRHRDSGNGQFITKRSFDRRDPDTVERERIKIDR